MGDRRVVCKGYVKTNDYNTDHLCSLPFGPMMRVYCQRFIHRDIL